MSIYTDRYADSQSPVDNGPDSPDAYDCYDQEQMSPSEQAARDRTVSHILAPLAACPDVAGWSVRHSEARRASVVDGVVFRERTEFCVTLDVILKRGGVVCGMGETLADAVLQVMARIAVVVEACGREAVTA